MKNSDYIVQEREPEFSRDCLHRPLFPVNMRLFKSSEPYQEHILGIVRYMSWIMDQRWEDYESNPRGGTFGISCANLGMAYNIIGYRTAEGEMRFMINPVIISRSDETGVAKSNCGSIKLKEKIPVVRPREIRVQYYDTDGEQHDETFSPKTGGYTITHEIEHNLGILITDRFIEQGGDPKLLESL